MKSELMEKHVLPVMNESILERMRNEKFTGTLSVRWQNGEIVKCDFSFNYRKIGLWRDVYEEKDD